MQKRVIIIGAGIAGVQAATQLSQSFSVMLINGEPYLPYYRMRLEEIVIGDPPESIYMHNEAWYSEKGIELISGRAEAINREEKVVILSDGRSFSYDFLVISVGSTACSLPLEGEGKAFTLRTISDALSLKKALASASSFAVVGGGLLGLELACSVSMHHRIPVTVIESAPCILVNQLDEESSLLLKTLIEERGVSIITGGRAVSYDSGVLSLSDGRKVQSDVLSLSVGVMPDIALASACGIETSCGIVIDRMMRTSDNAIYAAGDDVELSGSTFGLALHAREMGNAIASAIKGEDVLYTPSSPSVILKIGGINVSSFGSLRGEKHIEEDEGGRETIFVDNGIVNGAVLIGKKDRMSAVRAMIGSEYAL